MKNDFMQGDAWGTYVTLERSAPPERGMAYRTRVPGLRSPRSSRRWRKSTTGRRGTGGRYMNEGRVRDAHRPEPQCMPSTGELIDIERVTISLEGGRWKSTRWGNSLAAYPTARPVRGGTGRKGSHDLARGLPYLLRRSGHWARLTGSVRRQRYLDEGHAHLIH